MVPWKYRTATSSRSSFQMWQQQQPWDEILPDYPQFRVLKWEGQQQIPSAAVPGGAVLWSPFPTAGNGFGLARLCLTLSLLSWDLSGSSQALNSNLPKILGDP